jgi:hypothetical protein
MRKVLGVVAALTLSANAASAKDTYGDAGCGLGSLVFGNDPGLVQVLAATTNGTFGSQTFGISTGTSNCGASKGSKGAAIFIEANREALAKDISRGNGETIVTLTHITGCNDAKAVGATLQRSFASIYPSAAVSDEKVTESILATLKGQPALACGNI